jgi:hypothetical protein
MHIDFEAKIMAVQLTLDADEVLNIANMYRDAANQDRRTDTGTLPGPPTKRPPGITAPLVKHGTRTDASAMPKRQRRINRGAERPLSFWLRVLRPRTAGRRTSDY